MTDFSASGKGVLTSLRAGAAAVPIARPNAVGPMEVLAFPVAGHNPEVQGHSKETPSGCDGATWHLRRCPTGPSTQQAAYKVVASWPARQLTPLIFTSILPPFSFFFFFLLS